MLKELEYCNRVLVKNLRETDSPILKNLQNEIKESKCNLSLYCAFGEPSQKSRSMFRKQKESKEIVLYSNKLNSKFEIKEALVHEMVHAYDDCVLKINWKNNEELVCSEIKAANMAECSGMNLNENERKECVLKTSMRSLLLQTNKIENLEEILNRMMKKCFNKELS